VRQQLQNAHKRQLSKLETYVASRYFLDQHYQNRLQETDLWEHNIPTLEEYGQWTTKAAYLALEMLFNPTGESNAGVMGFTATIFLRLYGLELDLLRLLGVRYLITDMQLHDRDVVLRATQSAHGAPSMYLYEIFGANLGHWSPTQAVVARTFGEAMTLLRTRALDPTKTAVVFGPIEGPLAPAENVTFQFTRGGFQVTADAPGVGLIVLPVQYSTCWRPLDSTGAQGVELHRVNGFQTLLSFHNHISARFDFSFGLLGEAACRLRDINELKRLGVN